MPWLDTIGWLGSVLLIHSVAQARVQRFRVIRLAAPEILAQFVAVFEIWAMAAQNAALRAIHPEHLGNSGPAVRAAYLPLRLSRWGAAETLGITGVLSRQAGDHPLVTATPWWAPPTLLVVALGVLATVMWFRSVQLVEAGSPPAAGEPAEPRGDAVPGAP